MITRTASLLGVGHALGLDAQGLSTWGQLVNELEARLAEPVSMTLRVANLDRKWELVSAYQKSVRRGDLQTALPLVSAMVSMVHERQYMWARICVVSAEDIGPGDKLLMQFVLTCRQVYTPSILDERMSLNLWGYLTERMCLSQKSRVYCQLYVLKDYAKSHPFAFNSTEFGKSASAVLSLDLKSESLSVEEQWVLKASHRAEGLPTGALWLSRLGLPLTPQPQVLSSSETLYGLPDYAYDMHTRVGKSAYASLVWSDKIKQFFKDCPALDKMKAVSYAVFYVEGGQISQGIGSAQVDELTDLMTATILQWPVAKWLEFKQLVRSLVDDGVVRAQRLKCLESTYG